MALTPRSLISLLGLVICLPAVVQAKTIYVSKSGSNSNSCTAAQTVGTAKLTISGSTGGAACLVGGDTLSVGPGTYVENLDNAAGGNIPSGTSSAPTRFVTTTGARDVILKPNVYVDAAIGVNARHWVIFQDWIADCADAGTAQAHCVRTYGSGLPNDASTTNITFLRVEVRNAGATGFVLRGSFHKLIEVYSHHNGRNGLVPGMPCGNGIYLQGTDMLVDRSRSEWNGIPEQCGSGLTTPAGTSWNAANSIVRYSTFAYNFQCGILSRDYQQTTHNNLVIGNGHSRFCGGAMWMSNNDNVYNNTIVNNTNIPCVLQTSGSVDFRNNICYGNSSDSVSTLVGTISNNLTGTNPQFVNAADDNFALATGSPAINAGTVISSGCTANNCSGAFNGSAPDIGAFETLEIASSEVGAINASTWVINLRVNTAAFTPTYPASGATTFVLNGGPSHSGCTRNSATQYRCALTTPAVQGPTYTGTYTVGNVTDGADIGRGVGVAGSGKNQRLNAVTNFSVTNNVSGSGPVPPTPGSLIVREADPDLVEIHINTNDPPMLPASPTNATGFTFTNKTISGCLRDATDTKRFNCGVTAAFTCGEAQTASYSQGTGNVTSSASGFPELVAFSGAPITNQVSGDCPAATPIARWRFSEGTGTTTADETGNGHTGTISGAAWTTGISGGGLLFDGIDDYVEVADHNALDFTTAFTLMAHVKPSTTLTGFKAILVKNYKYYLYGSNSGQYCGAGFPFGGFSGTVARTACHASALPVGQWTHLAVTYDGAVLRLYRAGVEVASTTITDAATASTGTLRIGASPFTEFFPGVIDEVAVYNVALTAAEVAQSASLAETPTIASATVLDAAPGTVVACINTNDLPMLPASDCTGFTVEGHTITDCDRATNTACFNIPVTPVFTSGEQRTLEYSQTTGNVTSSHASTPELQGFTGFAIDNQVIDTVPTAPVIEQIAGLVECFGGAQATPNCNIAVASSITPTPGGKFKVRVRLENTGDADKGEIGYAPYFKKNATGDYVPISDVMIADGIYFCRPPEIQGQAATTGLLASGDLASFVPAGTQSTSSEATGVPLNRDTWTEYLGNFCLGSDVAPGDFFDFLWHEASGAALVATTVPRVTVGTGVGLLAGDSRGTW